MKYNLESNQASNFKLARHVARGQLEIMSTITPELYDRKFNYQLITSVTKFEIKKVYVDYFGLKMSRIFSFILKAGEKQQKKNPFKCT